MKRPRAPGRFTLNFVDWLEFGIPLQASHNPRSLRQIMVLSGGNIEQKTVATQSPSERDLKGMQYAIEQARIGFAEGGIPSTTVSISFFNQYVDFKPL